MYSCIEFPTLIADFCSIWAFSLDMKFFTWDFGMSPTSTLSILTMLDLVNLLRSTEFSSRESSLQTLNALLSMDCPLLTVYELAFAESPPSYDLSSK